MRTLIYSVLLALSISTTTAQDVCSSNMYKQLPCLKNKGEAIKFCNNATQTVTKTVSTTTMDWATQVLTQNASSQVTVRQTNYQTNYETIRITSTVTNTANQNDIIRATITTYVSAEATPSSNSTAAVAANRRRLRVEMRDDGGASCNATSVLEAFTAAEVKVQGTACSCLGLKAPTMTVTTTHALAGPTTTTTSIAGRASTTSVEFLALTTITKTWIDNITVGMPCPTSTSVLTLAAPSFKQVHGPKAGCERVASAQHAPAQRLGSNVTKISDAAAQCKDLCSQMSTCSHVYVQHMFNGWAFAKFGGSEPYYECFFNDKHFNATEDVMCGQREAIFGTAQAFDAHDRGQAPDDSDE